MSNKSISKYLNYVNNKKKASGISLVMHKKIMQHVMEDVDKLRLPTWFVLLIVSLFMNSGMRFYWPAKRHNG